MLKGFIGKSLTCAHTRITHTLSIATEYDTNRKLPCEVPKTLFCLEKVQKQQRVMGSQGREWPEATEILQQVQKQGDVLRFVSSAILGGKTEETAGVGGARGRSAPSPGAGSSLDTCGELPTQHQERGGARSSCAVPAPSEQTLRGQEKGNPDPSSRERGVER